jgi:3D (Asp-Asp-Asp) domain-containing protein
VSFTTSEPTLGRALIAAGYALYAADRITPPLDTPVEGPLEVTIERATPVTLRADGQERITRTHQRTVGGLLAELELALGGQDYSVPGPAAPLSAGLDVRVVRVSVEERIEEEDVPFETVYVPDPDMELDQQREIEAGEPGVLERRIRVRREDGRVVSEAAAGEWIAQQPRARVIAYGTRVVIRTTETPSGPLQYWRVLHVLATSYSPSTAGDKQPGDPFFGLSATGAPVVRGIVATDPRVIPLGTHLYVPGYGTGQALDVGGAVKGFRIDLGYDDAHLVLWNTWVDVYLLVPVPPPDEMVWVLPE